MATNYNSLIKSENKLKEQFYEYLKLTYEIHKKVWSYINIGKLNDVTMEDLYHDEEISDNCEKDILDECVWIISKDQPRSNHLRFIISIIYSIKDLERIADYAIDIAKIINSKDVHKDKLNAFKDFSSQYLNYFKLYIDLITKKNESDFFIKGKKIKDDFSQIYSEAIKKVFEACIKKGSDFHDVVLIMKAIDRSMHHVYNIFTNFKFIKNDKNATKRIG